MAEAGFQCIDRLLKRNRSGDCLDDAAAARAVGVCPEGHATARLQLRLYTLTPRLPLLRIAAGREGNAKGACCHTRRCLVSRRSCLAGIGQNGNAGKGKVEHYKKKQNASTCHGRGLEQGTAGHFGGRRLGQAVRVAGREDGVIRKNLTDTNTSHGSARSGNFSRCVAFSWHTNSCNLSHWK
jgi:hypothetical protein